LVNFYQTTRCYNPEDSNLQLKVRFRLQCGLVFLSSLGFIRSDGRMKYAVGPTDLEFYTFGMEKLMF
jgi:hypothetical protein